MQPAPFQAPTLEAMTRLLPAFDFSALIHADAHSAVYLATQRSLDREVAVRILSPAASSQDTFRQSFEQTARAMARLKHPNLIAVFDSGRVADMFYLIMEFVPGKSLERSAHGHRVELKQTLSLIDGICAGLAQAHAHGIVHGNLNPSRILLNRQAEPKIGNFGLPRQAAWESPNPFPSPPELASPDAPVTPAADIHAVGAILYQLITARPHSTDAPPPSSVTGIPTWLDEIWRKATHPSPNHRFASIRELKEALSGSADSRKDPKTPGPSTPQVAPKLATPPSTPPASPLLVAANPPAGPSPATPPAAPPAESSAEAAVPAKVGFNWKLLRNLVIIAGLLYAIHWTWHYRKAVLAENERKNRAAQAEEAAEKQRRLDEARTRPLPPTKGQSPSPSPQPRAETTAQALARLRTALAGGQRSEMPAAAIRRGNSDYLLVNNALTWPEAAWFAEQHGAHLAIPNAEADLTWLATQVAKGTPFWLGAGRSGRNSWTLANGTPWTPKNTPPGPGPYLSADDQGSLFAAGSEKRLPFILQWQRDGSNPAALATQLANTAASIKAGKPVFPPGIRVLGNRFFLTVIRDVDWQKAADLASSSGGHLAVVSDPSEATQLAELTKDLAPNQQLWLGASARSNQWQSVTGERWAADVKTLEPTAGLALCMLPDGSLDARPAGKNLGGFVIEWSRDRMNAANSR